MKNKPVAVVRKYTVSGIDNFHVEMLERLKEGTELYTDPVKEYKEPSVKEIEDLWLDVVNNIPANDHRPREWHFANAILRKAQEK